MQYKIPVSHDKASCLQPKMQVAPKHDVHEQEADAVADRVTRMPLSGQQPCGPMSGAPGQQNPLPVTAMVQRKGIGTASVSGKTQQGIAATKGGGQGLDSQSRSFMEGQFGRDFGNVRIHVTDQAAQLSQNLNARAFTIGQDIYFNRGEYRPQDEAGKHLLAHELTHTVQQAGAETVQRAPQPFQAEGLAIQLQDAMEPIGTDEDAIYAALAGRTPDQMEAIRDAYKRLTGRALEADLRDELDDDELANLNSVRVPAVAASPPQRWETVAKQLHDAMSGPGTSEEPIYAALSGRSALEFMEISNAYAKLYETKSLMAELKDELTEEEMQQLQVFWGESPGCTGPQTAMIQEGITRASKWVATAITRLGESPMSAKVEGAITSNFGAAHATPENLPQFVSKLRRAHREMASVSISCVGMEVPECRKDNGFTASAGAHAFFLCSNNVFSGGAPDMYTLPKTILHEAFHSSYPDFDGDSYASWTNPGKKDKNYPGPVPLRNADSYATLVVDLQ